MTPQLALVTIPPTVLKPRQQRAWDLIRSVPGGVTADEIGAVVHGHTDDEPRCDWCAVTGRQAANSKALKPLIVKRRRSARYEPRDPKLRATLPSSQLVELPDDLFGGNA